MHNNVWGSYKLKELIKKDSLNTKYMFIKRYYECGNKSQQNDGQITHCVNQMTESTSGENIRPSKKYAFSVKVVNLLKTSLSNHLSD